MSKNQILDNWKWPFLRINSYGSNELMCPHGVGHGGTHGCDGCCTNKSFKIAYKNYGKTKSKSKKISSK